MSFVEACRKEAWFFDTLFGKPVAAPGPRDLCGIVNFRAQLVELYEQFVAAQIKLAAPAVFTKAVEYGKHMLKEWAWKADEECYEDSERMMEELKDMIRAIVQSGKATSQPTSVVEILLREDVRDCIEECRKRARQTPRSALQNSKQDLLYLMASVTANLIEQVHAATHKASSSGS